MKKILLIFCADFLRILSTISPANRVKTYCLFFFMALQSALELFFILSLTWLGAALTTPQSLSSNYIFRGLFFLFPQLGRWGENPRYLLLIVGCLVVTISIFKNLLCYILSLIHISEPTRH